MIQKTTHACIVLALAVFVLAASAPAQKKSSSKTSASAKGKTKNISFDDIKFKMKKGSKFKKKMITTKIKKMNKKVVRIKGWIHPLSAYKQKGITRFVLVRDNRECCFGPGAALYDCIVVRMATGKSTSFTTKPIAVEGTFLIKPLKDIRRKGKHLAIYAMTATKAK